MGEGLLFIILAIIAILSAAAVIFLRGPLQSTLAAAINVVSIIFLFVLLQAPIIAIVQFVVLILLFAGTVQMIRGFGPQYFYTRRRLTFVQTLGLLLSFFLGVLVLFHLTAISREVPPSDVGVPLSFAFGLMPEGLSVLALAGMLVFAGVVGFRFLSQNHFKRHSL